MHMLWLIAWMSAHVAGSIPANSHQPDGRITVVGKALNSKGSAIVQTDSTFYLIEGLDAWDDYHYGKKVRVTGKLKTLHNKPVSSDSLLVQERAGTVRIIRHAKWKLVEERHTLRARILHIDTTGRTKDEYLVKPAI